MQTVYDLTCSFYACSMLGFQAMFGLCVLGPTVCVATSSQFVDINSYSTGYGLGYTFKIDNLKITDSSRRGQFRCSARQCSPEHVPSA